MTSSALFLAVFLACVVEAVEATTIVLAAGTARSWRSALQGVVAGVATLSAIVIALGPAVAQIPLGDLRLLVGGILLIFGLQWLRKAILRAGGHKAMHDEELIYQAQLSDARRAGGGSRRGVTDWYAFTLSFKGVVLEGLEVVFIVLTFGSNQRDIPLAAGAAVIAVLVVAVAGFAIRAPLARVPENTLKFAVGVMLTAFGMFWGAEGAHARWPGSDAALLVLVPAVALVALGLVAVLRRRSIPEPARGVGGTRGYYSMNARLRRFGAFWYDFIVGDDWVTAVGVVVALAATTPCRARTLPRGGSCRPRSWCSWPRASGGPHRGCSVVGAVAAPSGHDDQRPDQQDENADDEGVPHAESRVGQGLSDLLRVDASRRRCRSDRLRARCRIAEQRAQADDRCDQDAKHSPGSHGVSPVVLPPHTNYT